MGAVWALIVTFGQRMRAVGLLWLCGICLRMTILAVPPVLPAIHADLRLSATEIGLLGSLPIALFALAALPGSLLIVRFGAKAALLGGLLITAVGSVLRGFGSDVSILFSATALMGCGIAVMQPSMPVLVRTWLPSRIGFGTALYSNGLLFGEVLPVWLTVPAILPLVGGSWRADLAVWSAPIVAAAILVALFAPPQTDPIMSTSLAGRRWWPDWKTPRIWLLGLLFGCINSIYFTTNFFLPDFLTALGHGERIGGALTALNLAQMPSSLLLLAVAGKIERRAWPYLVLAGIMAAGIGGLAFVGGPATWLWTALIGFGTSATMILGLTLPALLCEPHDVGRTSAGMFAISYASGVAVAIVSGALWDLSAVPRLVFLPIALCAAALEGAALALKRYRQLR